MANGALFQTYDFGFAAGSSNREDLLDVIVNIAPYETPFFSTAPKTTTRHTTHEWLEDTLTTASGNPYGYFEGQDFSAQAVANRSRKSNITQIFRKDFNVSETQRTVNPAGIKDEYAYQVGIALKELARHIETRVFASAVSASGASATARLMKPLEGFITTNTASAASGLVTKASLDLLIEAVYVAGGNPDRLYVHPNTKSQYASVLGGASGVNYRNIAANDQRVISNIDVYHSNFNIIQLVPDRFVPSAAATTGYGRNWLIETAKARIAFLRPVKHVPLPPNGDSTRGMVLGELTMELLAEAAHGKIINQATA